MRALLPHAERAEVLDDLTAEYRERALEHGRAGACLWVWRQILGSIPALLRRSWWRAQTGFEPRANRMQSGGPAMEQWVIDVRYSARRLASRPMYLVLAVLTLALGTGGTAAVYSVARTSLLDPLPVAREAEVGVLWMPGYWNEAEFLHVRDDTPGFQQLAAIRPLDATLERPGEPLRLIRGLGTSAELFDVLGAAPLLGRTFQRGDDLPGTEPVAVLSHGLWQELGGQPSLVGQQLTLGGVRRTVVGVMPRPFWFPNPEVRLWTTMALSDANTSGNYAFLGRIAPDARMHAMEVPLGAIAESLKERFQYPASFDKTRSPGITPLREHLVGDARPGVLATLAAMGVILLIACVNVAALMLGQVGGRSTELAVRSALGAGRRRLTQQLIVEAMLIGLLAGIVGAGFAAAGFRILTTALPLGPLAETAQLDWRMFRVAIGLSVLASAVVAAIPGVVLWRGSLQHAMATTRAAGLSMRGGRLEGALVVGQIALAVLLVAGAGLVIRSVAHLRDVDPGIRVDRLAVIDATMPTRLTADERRRAVLEFLPSLQALPNVKAAAASQKLPLRGQGDDWGMAVEGKPDLEPSTTYVRVVTHDYFEALGTAVRRGRGFQPTDRADTERVVVINEALAQKYFAGEDPLGRVVHTGFDERGERVVGVIGNIAETELTSGAVPARYMLYDQVPGPIGHWTSFVMSVERVEDLPIVLQAGRAVLQRDGHQLAFNEMTTMSLLFEEALGAPGRLMPLLSLLAALALLLGAVGVYGMISHLVARRTREYGIRIAIGLEPARLAGQVMARGLTLVALGSAVGIIAALMLTRALSSLLYGVDATDPQAMGGAVLALLVTGLVAAFVPARRASRTNPSILLRQP